MARTAAGCPAGTGMTLKDGEDYYFAERLPRRYGDDPGRGGNAPALPPAAPQVRG